METETESFSSSNSDILPKDYSLCSMIVQNEVKEKSVTSKSMKLNFGVDRLLAKCDKKVERNQLSENFFTLSPSENEQIVQKLGNNQMQLNLLHQQLTNTNSRFLNNNFVLKPFPLRLERNENGRKKHSLKLNKAFYLNQMNLFVKSFNSLHIWYRSLAGKVNSNKWLENNLIFSMM